jgi:hypothetical protein
LLNETQRYTVLAPFIVGRTAATVPVSVADGDTTTVARFRLQSQDDIADAPVTLPRRALQTVNATVTSSIAGGWDSKSMVAFGVEGRLRQIGGPSLDNKAYFVTLVLLRGYVGQLIALATTLT